jgi:hypothetical protein
MQTRSLDYLLAETRRVMPESTLREAVLLASAVAAAAKSANRYQPVNSFLRIPHQGALVDRRAMGTYDYPELSISDPLRLVVQLTEKFPTNKVDALEINQLTGSFARELTSERLRVLVDELADAWSTLQERDLAWPTREIARFILDAVGAAPGDRIRCLGPGAEALAIESLLTDRVPVLVAEALPPMAQMLAILTDARADLDRPRLVDATRPPQQWWSEARAEVVLPRFGMPLRLASRARTTSDETEMSEWTALEYACLSKTRVVAVLVANRVLHSRGADEAELRKRVINSGRVRAIVSLPQGALAEEDVPSAIFLFDHSNHRPYNSTVFCRVDGRRDFTFLPGKLRTHDRRFSATERVLRALQNPTELWCRAVPHDEIASENYVLQVDRYLDREVVQSRIGKAARHRQMAKLGDIADITKAQTLRSSSEESAIEIHEASPGEFPEHGYLCVGPRKRRVDVNDLRRYSAQQIEPGDVLLSTKGTIGRTAICAPKDRRFVATPSTAILRLRPTGPIRDSVVLLMYLRSPLFQDQLRAITAGTTIPNVSLPDLRNLPIVIARPQEQHELHAAFEVQNQLQLQISELQARQTTAALDAWRALGIADSEDPA